MNCGIVQNRLYRMQLLVYCFIAIAILGPLASGSSNSSETDYFRYLQQFGYTPKLESRRLFSVVDKSSYNDGIKKFQRLYKLPVSMDYCRHSARINHEILRKRVNLMTEHEN